MSVHFRLRTVKALLGIAALAAVPLSAATAHALVSNGGHSSPGATTVVAEGDTPIITGKGK
jgi:hypothetical protein